jgi:hypothetical protein
MLNRVDLRAGNNFRVFTLTADGTWRQVPAMSAIGVLLRTLATNTTNLLIAASDQPAASQQGTLAPDRSLSLDINNANLIWYKASSGSPVFEVWCVLSSTQP